MQLNGWDGALKVTADGKGLIGHAGAVLLRKAADQLGLTAGLSAALLKKGTSPLLDRGTVLASLAVAIALGATSMSDIDLLTHLAPVLGDAPSGPTVRRALGLAGAPAMLDRVARARAKAREHAWNLIEATPAGFPWPAVAGKTLTGWLVIDMDATLVTAHSPARKRRPPRGRRATASTARRLVREHPRVPPHAAAARQRRVKHVHRSQAGTGSGREAGPGPVPAQDPRPRRRPAPATTSSSTSSPSPLRGRKCCSPAAGPARPPTRTPSSRSRPGHGSRHRPGRRAGERQRRRGDHWPDDPRGEPAKRAPLDRPQGEANLRNLTEYEKKTGWKYSITCTNIADDGTPSRASRIKRLGRVP
jgi:Transposase DDE domain group 1